MSLSSVEDALNFACSGRCSHSHYGPNSHLLSPSKSKPCHSTKSLEQRKHSAGHIQAEPSRFRKSHSVSEPPIKNYVDETKPKLSNPSKLLSSFTPRAEYRRNVSEGEQMDMKLRKRCHKSESSNDEFSSTSSLSLEYFPPFTSTPVPL